MADLVDLTGQVVQWNGQEGVIEQEGQVRRDGKKFRHHLRLEDIEENLTKNVKVGTRFLYDVILDDKAPDPNKHRKAINLRLLRSGKGEESQKKKLEYSLELSSYGPTRLSIVGQVNKKPAELTYAISAVGPGADKARFMLLNAGEKFEFAKFHSGLRVEDGMVDFEVEYPLASLDIMVRCIESNITKHLTLWKK